MSQDAPPVKPPIPAQLPNALTVLRLVLVPVFVVLMFVEPGVGFGWRLAGTAAFGLAILTDYFDGMLARKYGLVSDFGKIWDPIADKALTGAAFIVLSIFGELPWWITVLILAREWGDHLDAGSDAEVRGDGCRSGRKTQDRHPGCCPADLPALSDLAGGTVLVLAGVAGDGGCLRADRDHRGDVRLRRVAVASAK